MFVILWLRLRQIWWLGGELESTMAQSQGFLSLVWRDILSKMLTGSGAGQDAGSRVTRLQVQVCAGEGGRAFGHKLRVRGFCDHTTKA